VKSAFCRKYLNICCKSTKVWGMTEHQILSKLGGPSRIGRRLGVKPQAVSGWKSRGIPMDRIPSLLRMAKEKGLNIGPEALRPDLDWSGFR
jgi:DNA-binding transcriptional regulator YdaS (Cro superfamily)